jgi:hypothetical protein
VINRLPGMSLFDCDGLQPPIIAFLKNQLAGLHVLWHFPAFVAKGDRVSKSHAPLVRSTLGRVLPVA